MLDILGTIGGNILSLPGVLGLAPGMTTRRIWLGGLLGGIVGVIETIIFANGQIAKIETTDLFVAIIVGILAGSIGSAIRVKGATV